MLGALDAKHKKILQFILDRNQTTYEELSAYMNQSKKTVAKYVDELRETVQSTGVQLVVRQNKGIYLEGDIKKLGEWIRDMETRFSNSKEDRSMFVYTRFLTTTHHLKVQELADELFVSRSTLENTLKEVKKDFDEQGYEIENSKDGMILKASEKERRNLISKLLNYFWGNVTYLDDKEENLKTQLQMTPEIENVLNIDTLYRVISVIKEFSRHNKLTFTDYEYKSLVIHLTIALDRIKEDKFLELPNDQTQPLEEDTLNLIRLMEQEFKVTIPPYEKGYMNNHVTAIKRSEQNHIKQESFSTGKSTELKQVILNGLEGMDADDELLNSLVLHLDAAVKRLQLGLSIHNPYTEKIKLSFPRAFDSAVSLTSVIEDTYDIQLNDDEIAYIALHFEAFFERRPDKKRRKNVILVCSSGLGTSKLLEQRINNNFSHALHVTEVLSVRDLGRREISADFIISTIPLDEVDIPVVVVSPLLGHDDLDSIRQELSIMYPSEQLRAAFLSNVENDLLFISDIENDNKTKVLTTICDSLLGNGYANKGILDNALKREELSSTAMGTFAMPHAEIEYVAKSGIAVYVNEKGINWDGKLVYVVFFFALNNQVKPMINQIYEYFNNLVSDEAVLESLSLANDKQELRQLLKRV